MADIDKYLLNQISSMQAANKDMLKQQMQSLTQGTKETVAQSKQAYNTLKDLNKLTLILFKKQQMQLNKQNPKKDF